MQKLPLALLAMLGAWPALAADPVADFYKGKQMQFIIRTPPGGDYDSYSRLLARHMGRHIPGSPTISPMNMPGGGGLRGRKRQCAAKCLNPLAYAQEAVVAGALPCGG